jgi:hypothetical protein
MEEEQTAINASCAIKDYPCGVCVEEEEYPLGYA